MKTFGRMLPGRPNRGINATENEQCDHIEMTPLIAPGSSMSRAGLRFWSAVLAFAVFLVDVLTPLEGAVAVLYVVAILLAAKTTRRDDIIVAASAAASLRSPPIYCRMIWAVASPALRALVSLAAVGITTLLALQNQAATKRLAAQARLLNLSHDMIFVRDRGDVITFWNKAAEEAYGWPAEEATGKSPTSCCRTIYPDRREVIEDVLIDIGRWEGRLEQRTKAGGALPSIQDGHCSTTISANPSMCSKPTPTLPIGRLHITRWYRASSDIAGCLTQAGLASSRRIGAASGPH